ncbi:MAG TPA: PP2C family serine/threonine-protein phosphatase [Ktedonobacteraceae bacterium]
MTTNELAWPTQAAYVSDAGRVRQQNEDCGLVDLKRTLFIVSDGMGGHQSGEAASRSVVTMLPHLIEQRVTLLPPPSTEAIGLALRDAIVELSQRLRAESAGRAGLQGMGATVAVAWLRGSIAHLAHIGDSRIYLFRHERLMQLTEDHSVIALLLRHGEITLEEVQTHPMRGRLSRYVGMEGEVSPDVQTVQLQAGDRLLLCSDGLTNMVSGTQIAHLLQINAEPAGACRALVNAANAAGGTDNITALVVDCGSGEASRENAGEASMQRQDHMAQ